MKELETLLNRRWILKSEDRELYYKIRDSIGEIRKFATEKMGCQVIENALAACKDGEDPGAAGDMHGN